VDPFSIITGQLVKLDAALVITVEDQHSLPTPHVFESRLAQLLTILLRPVAYRPRKLLSLLLHRSTETEARVFQLECADLLVQLFNSRFRVQQFLLEPLDASP
jgi:hypothetical protein